MTSSAPSHTETGSPGGRVGTGDNERFGGAAAPLPFLLLMDSFCSRGFRDFDIHTYPSSLFPVPASPSNF